MLTCCAVVVEEGTPTVADAAALLGRGRVGGGLWADSVVGEVGRPLR